MFSFKCASCGEVHEGMPNFGAHAPLSYYDVPQDERDSRCDLGSGDCVIDEEMFFVRGCIDIPVIGEEEPFNFDISRETVLADAVRFGFDSHAEAAAYLDAKMDRVEQAFAELEALLGTKLWVMMTQRLRDNLAILR